MWDEKPLIILYVVGFGDSRQYTYARMGIFRLTNELSIWYTIAKTDT